MFCIFIRKGHKMPVILANISMKAALNLPYKSFIQPPWDPLELKICPRQKDIECLQERKTSIVKEVIQVIQTSYPTIGSLWMRVVV